MESYIIRHISKERSYLSRRFISYVNYEKVTVTGDVDSIEADFFAGSDKLVEVELPDTIRRFDSRVFARCVNLNKIKPPPSSSSDEGVSFRIKKAKMVDPMGSPNNVTET